MKVICNICTRNCLLEEGQTGFCKGRIVKEGKVISKNYGVITSLSLDNVEKKPLHNYMPGKKVLSVGSFGCNFTCPFCQNYQIACSDGSNIEKIYLAPEELVKRAEELIVKDNIGIAYTYNEPLIGYEYVIDCSKLAHEKNMKNILVTNGSINKNIFKEVIEHIDAVNIDLKGFNEDFYRSIGGDLNTVLENIKIASENCHVEITTLVIPRLRNNEDEIRRIAKFIKKIDSKIPLHISRFFPAYKMYDESPTNVDTVYNYVDIVREYLEYVYPGNC